MASNYEAITKQNMINYGTSIWYEDILTNMYSDKTHFIFELLQNAEDAKATFVEFHLFEDRLEFLHNGKRLFTKQDVIGICSLAKSNKKDDLTQIGKFGLGFKSVYSFTDRPIIISGDECFAIEKYVRPIKESYINLSENTKILIPFKNVDNNDYFNKIKTKLNNLNLRILLFLKNIKKIVFTVDNIINKTYDKNKTYEGYNKSIISIKTDNLKESWLVYSKEISGILQTVDLAFKIDKEFDYCFEEAENTCLNVFFPTEKETNLKFLVQAPFKTTHNRENVPFTEKGNIEMIRLLGELLKFVIKDLSQNKQLNFSFLNLLPLNKEHVRNDLSNCLFKVLVDLFKSDEKLILNHNQDYLNSNNIFIPKSKEIFDLVDETNYFQLFNEKKYRINKDIFKYSLVRTFLIEEINVFNLTDDILSKTMDLDFFNIQNDKWIMKFYKYLSDNKNLISRINRTWSNYKGIFYNAPFIRLSNNQHISLYDEDKLQVYFSSNNQDLDASFHIIKGMLLQDEEIISLFKYLNIKKPNVSDFILKKILPKYENPEKSVKHKDNYEDLKIIYNLFKDNECELGNLREQIKDTPILLATNSKNETIYKKPLEIYIHNEKLGLFFDNNYNIFFIFEGYSYDDVFLLKLGVNDKIKIKKRESRYGQPIILQQQPGGHKRGLNGFDPDFEIEGLDIALKKINLQKSKIIWDLLLNHVDLIFGTVETSTRQDYSNARKENKFSVVGKLIMSHKWLPKDDLFIASSNILLDELPSDFEKETINSKRLSELILKKSLSKEILELTKGDEEKAKEINFILNATDEERELAKQTIMRIRNKSSRTSDELQNQGYGAYLVDKQGNSNDFNITQINIESPKKFVENESVNNKIEENIEEREKKIITMQHGASKIDEDVKNYIYIHYLGQCQICQERIFSRDRKPHLIFKRRVESKESIKGINGLGNILGLCPNCNLRFKLGLLEFIKGDEPSTFPDFDNLNQINQNGKEYFRLRIKVANKPYQYITFTKDHLNKFKELYDKY